jgi:hypothetical protein
MKQVIPTDVYDKDGNLTRIDFYNEAGDFEIQVVWDDRDPQDSEHRIKFREWAYRMLGQKDLEVMV